MFNADFELRLEITWNVCMGFNEQLPIIMLVYTQFEGHGVSSAFARLI